MGGTIAFSLQQGPVDITMSSTAMAKKKPTKRQPPKDPNEEVTFLMRLPWSMHHAISQDAEQCFRSLNLHLQWLIQQRLNELRAETGQEP